MQYPLCGHEKTHKHGKTSKGRQRYLCPHCEKTFTDTFDTIYYRRHLDSDEVHRILQSHTEGSSLRGISRIVQRSYGTVVSLVEELMTGDCWIGLSLAQESGLILAARVGKHTDAFIEELINNTEGKTDCPNWSTDGWGGYERVLSLEVNHQIGKDKTQKVERTNGIIRQQTP